MAGVSAMTTELATSTRSRSTIHAANGRIIEIQEPFGNLRTSFIQDDLERLGLYGAARLVREGRSPVLRSLTLPAPLNSAKPLSPLLPPVCANLNPGFFPLNHQCEGAFRWRETSRLATGSSRPTSTAL